MRVLLIDSSFWFSKIKEDNATMIGKVTAIQMIRQVPIHLTEGQVNFEKRRGDLEVIKVHDSEIFNINGKVLLDAHYNALHADVAVFIVPDLTKCHSDKLVHRALQLHRPYTMKLVILVIDNSRDNLSLKYNSEIDYIRTKLEDFLIISIERCINPFYTLTTHVPDIQHLALFPKPATSVVKKTKSNLVIRKSNNWSCRKAADENKIFLKRSDFSTMDNVLDMSKSENAPETDNKT